MEIAKYVRIFELDPSDDFVTKRSAAVNAIRDKIVHPNEVESLSNQVAAACSFMSDAKTVPATISTVVEATIRDHSPAFVAEGHELELGVCLSLAIMDAIESAHENGHGWGHAEVLAAGVWSSMTFLPSCTNAKLENLKINLIKIAQNRIDAASLRARTRVPVSDFGQFGDTAIASDDFKKATESTIENLRRNAALDREEIDLLWWALNGVSTTMHTRFSKLSDVTSAVCAGIEVGATLRALPAQSHRNLTLRNARDDLDLSAQEVTEALSNDRESIAKSIQESHLINRFPQVFPLSYAVLNGKLSVEGSNVARPVAEWSLRALLESAFCRAYRQERRET